MSQERISKKAQKLWNLTESYCVNCNSIFYKLKKSRHNVGSRFVAIRRSNATTCSKKCSRELHLSHHGHLWRINKIKEARERLLLNDNIPL